MSDALHRDPAVVAHAEAVLAGLAEDSRALVYGSLLTDDGFLIAQVRAGGTDGGRFASMASAMQALSEAVVRELSIGDAEYVVIAAGEGHVIQRRVPGQTVVLAALFDTDETLGKALAATKISAQRMTALPRTGAQTGDGPASESAAGAPLLQHHDPTQNS
ncbi:roadblock/LC7 domain-containing protein [Homoserinibacter sp. YIM 151385]|uniref:roadblock/LC7 domain-containing protein n=1 Tax=Homoserinibacter sp. YIM 151385 TaxID=2985506 RepID=UPI0022F104E0|nr:roadblock/LC7 domain-containing protein [Homoserinibacter sp. YIM 151385]WBU39209.1 roadblock/LC7 domain-containing protein [Homoserinibacter sp. YIM 151385]